VEELGEEPVASREASVGRADCAVEGREDDNKLDRRGGAMSREWGTVGLISPSSSPESPMENSGCSRLSQLLSLSFVRGRSNAGNALNGVMGLFSRDSDLGSPTAEGGPLNVRFAADEPLPLPFAAVAV
jgi:hypothetical protein